METESVLKRYLWISLGLLLLFCAVSPAQAQENQPPRPVYVVENGDTLWNIARRLHIPYQQLLSENNLTEDSAIHPGEKLVIPLSGSISGVLTTKKVSFGESLRSLSDRYRISEEKLVRLNRLTSPMELYAGVSVVLLGDEKGDVMDYSGTRVALREGSSLLEAAVEEGVNPWTLVADNDLQGTWDVLPGEVVRAPGDDQDGPGSFPEAISRVGYTPDTFVQGNTMVIRLRAPSGATVQGRFGDHELHFYPDGYGYVALQGISAVSEPGIRPLSIYGELEDGTPFAHRQMVRVHGGEFNYVKINGVPPETVSVQLSRDEHEKLASYASKITPKKMWSGKFSVPVPAKFNNPYPLYGDRRSFNGSGFLFYHSGIDFSTYAFNIDIYAAAAGKVVYTGKNSPIYGGVTMIDHGWGVFTVYGHQAEILVEEGQRVRAGDLIGKVGSSGRSTGPHLHWEVWVGGVSVDPLVWLEEQYP